MFKKTKVNMKEGRIHLLKSKLSEMIDVMLKNDIEIFLAPTSRDIFLIDRNKNIKVYLKDKSIKVSGHEFKYSESLPLVFTEEQKAKVTAVLEIREANLKKEVFKEDMDSINGITELYSKDEI